MLKLTSLDYYVFEVLKCTLACIAPDERRFFLEQSVQRRCFIGQLRNKLTVIINFPQERLQFLTIVGRGSCLIASIDESDGRLPFLSIM